MPPLLRLYQHLTLTPGWHRHLAIFNPTTISDLSPNTVHSSFAFSFSLPSTLSCTFFQTLILPLVRTKNLVNITINLYYKHCLIIKSINFSSLVVFEHKTEVLCYGPSNTKSFWHANLTKSSAHSSQTYTVAPTAALYSMMLPLILIFRIFPRAYDLFSYQCVPVVLQN